MVDYFDTNHTFNLFGADEYTPEALAYRQAAGLSPALDAAGAAVQAAHRTSCVPQPHNLAPIYPWPKLLAQP